MCVYFFFCFSTGKFQRLKASLVFGSLVWRQGCVSGDSGSLFQPLPHLFVRGTMLKSNLKWREEQKKTKNKNYTKAQETHWEEWRLKDATTLIESWSWKGFWKSLTLILQLKKLRTRVCQYLKDTHTRNELVASMELVLFFLVSTSN